MSIMCLFFLLLLSSLMLHVGRIFEVRGYGSFSFTLMTQNEKDSFSVIYGLTVLAFSIYAGLLTSAGVYMKMYENDLSFSMFAGIFMICVGVWAATSLSLGLFLFILSCTPIISESENSSDGISKKILMYSVLLVSLAVAGVGYYIYEEMGLSTLLSYSGGSILIGAPLYFLRYHRAKLRAAVGKARDNIGELTSLLSDDTKSKASIIQYCLRNSAEDVLDLCWNASVDFDDEDSRQAVKRHIELNNIEITQWMSECPDSLKHISLKIMVS